MSRAEILAKFRSHATQRVERMLAYGSGPRDERWRELVGELHTTKGEARMLGLASMSTAVHAIEDAIGAERPWAAVSAALAALGEMIASELVENDEAKQALATILALLSGETADDAPVAKKDALDARPVEVAAPELDALCNELEALRADVARWLAPKAAPPERAALEDLLARLEKVSSDASELRLASLEPLLAMLSKHGTDLATAEGKLLDVEIDAGGAVLERGVLDALQEPLLHLVRNAVDHGLEPPDRRGDKSERGRLRIEARTLGDGVTLTVTDDGPGLDADALRAAAVARGLLASSDAAALSDEDAHELVFRSGLSTRSRATDVSGRGVGLDVVRRRIERLGGSVTLTSRKGEGCSVVIVVPVGLARERVVLTTAGPVLIGIPARQVLHIAPLAEDAIVPAGTGAAIRVGDAHVPIVSLAKTLGLEGQRETHALVIELGERRYALAIEALRGEQPVLRRAADAPLAALGIAAASALTDDGRVVLLPSLSDVVRRAHVARAPAPVVAPRRAPRKERRAMIVDDSAVVRELLAELLGSAGFSVVQAVDGQDALERLPASACDVVITDVEMPRLGGLDLVRAIRGRGVQVPVVVVTTRGSADDRRRAAECGADAYVVKDDFRAGELLGVVRGLLEGA